MTHFRNDANRPAIGHFDEMAALVGISAVLYGMATVLAESFGGKIMFYTLSQIGKAMKAVKEQHRAEFMEQIRTDPKFRDEVAKIMDDVEPAGRRRHRRRHLADPVDDAG